MLKMLVQVRRKPGMSDQAFYDRWQSEHGALVKRSSRAMAFLAYIQTHCSGMVSSNSVSWMNPSPSDGQAALWWPSEEAMHAALSSPEGIAANTELETDEQAFTDTGALSAFVVAEELEIQGCVPSDSCWEGEVKLLLELRKRPEIDANAFTRLWRGSHATLLRQSIADLGCSRILQNHPDRGSAFDFAADRGWLVPPDGIEELWWENEDAMRRALASTQGALAFAALGENVGTFAPRPQSYLGVEKVIFDYRQSMLR